MINIIKQKLFLSILPVHKRSHREVVLLLFVRLLKIFFHQTFHPALSRKYFVTKASCQSYSPPLIPWWVCTHWRCRTPWWGSSWGCWGGPQSCSRSCPASAWSCQGSLHDEPCPWPESGWSCRLEPPDSNHKTGLIEEKKLTVTLNSSSDMLAKMLDSGELRILNDTAQWWFSRGDMSLYLDVEWFTWFFETSWRQILLTWWLVLF